MRIGIDLDHVVYPFTDVVAHYVHKATGRSLHELGASGALGLLR